MFVIARNYGQLGNRLFLFAHFIAASREWGVPLRNPCFAEYADFFKSTRNDLWCEYPLGQSIRGQESATPSLEQRKRLAKAVYLGAKSLRVVQTVKSAIGFAPKHTRVVQIRLPSEFDLGDESFGESISNYRYWFALGWLFRSDRLFAKHSAAIREHFQLTDEHARAVRQKLCEVRSAADVVVGVHIRGGDYATYLGGKYHYNTSQYLAVMHSIAEQLPGRRVVFLVSSNEQLRQGDFPGLRVHFGPGHLAEDMYTLAGTDLIVGPPSTFSGWAAFYGNTPLVVLEHANGVVDVAKHCPYLYRRAA